MATSSGFHLDLTSCHAATGMVSLTPWCLKAGTMTFLEHQTVTSFPGASIVAAEIVQQPALWQTTLNILRNAGISDLTRGPVLLTGAGTSAYAASAIAEACPGAKAIATTDLLSLTRSELQRTFPEFESSGLLISLARSGDSPESTAVVERIKNVFPFVQHLAIVCNANGKLAHLPGVNVISLDPRTNDRSLAMTSSFSNLVLSGLCLQHLSHLSSILPGVCNRVSGSLQSANDIAAQIAATGVDRVVVLASVMPSLAREGALKVIELSAGRVLAMPETFLGVRHGPQSFIRRDTPIICFVSSDPYRQRYEKDLISGFTAQGLGRIVVVADSGAGWACDWFVHANAFELPDELRTPFEISFMQLLAFNLGIHAGVDPDNPSPEGIVTRVVRPFKIHVESD